MEGVGEWVELGVKGRQQPPIEKGVNRLSTDPC
jgi:hypothetical protein